MATCDALLNIVELRIKNNHENSTYAKIKQTLTAYD